MTTDEHEHGLRLVSSRPAAPDGGMENATSARRRPARAPVEAASSAAERLLGILLVNEKNDAWRQLPELVRRLDPDGAHLLWFAIGAIDGLCRHLDGDGRGLREELFSRAAQLIFAGCGGEQGYRPGSGSTADSKSIELFESIGRHAAQACLRRESSSFFYGSALTVLGQQRSSSGASASTASEA